MATIKSYTDLEQSKKLAEILPLESADAIYEYYGAKLETSKLIEKPIYWLVIKGFESRCRFSTSKKDVPCWSIAALMKIIEIDKSEICFDCCYGEKYRVNVHYQTLGSFCQDNELYESKIDALFAMIIKLHKRNLL